MTGDLGNTPRPDHLPAPGPGYHVTLTEFDPATSTEVITEVNDGVTESATTKTWQTQGDRLRQETRVVHGNDAKPDLTVTIRDALTKQLIRRNILTTSIFC